MVPPLVYLLLGVVAIDVTSAATIILRPEQVSAIASQYTVTHIPVNTVNRKGMLTAATHSNAHVDMWLSESGGSTQITFMFDDAYSIREMKVWNYNQPFYTSRGMRHVSLEYSKNGYLWKTLYRDYEIDQAMGNNGALCTESIDCKGVVARYIRLSPHALTGNDQSGNWGYVAQSQVGLSEVEFEVSEPDYLGWNPVTMSVSADSAVDMDHRPDFSVNGAGLNALGFTHKNSSYQNAWLSLGHGETNPHFGTKSGKAWVKYEFDKIYKLHSMRVWNYGEANGVSNGLRNVTIEYSTDNRSWITLPPENGGENFVFNKAAGVDDYFHETVINFLGREAKYVVITALAADGNWGGDAWGIAEARFRATDSGPGIAAFCGIGDHLWVAGKEPVDSLETTSAMFEWMSSTYNIDRMYWRDASVWHDEFNFGRETQLHYDYHKWESHLRQDVAGYANAGVDAAREHDMEIWLYTGLFEAGVQPDVGIINRPYMFEDNIRLVYPEMVPLNRWGNRKHPGMLAFCYPEVRAEVIDRYIAHMVNRGYDGINFYTYVENTGIRYEDEFGFDQPILDEFNTIYPGVDLREGVLTAEQREFWHRCQGKFVTIFLSELKERLKHENMRLSVILDPNEPDYPQPLWGTSVRGTGKIQMDWKKWIDDGIVDEIWVQLADVVKQKALLDELLLRCSDKPIKLSVRTTDPLGESWSSYRARGVATIAVITWENNNGIEKYSLEATNSATLGSTDWKVRLQTLSDISKGAISVDPGFVASLANDPNVLVRRMMVKALAKLGDVTYVSIIENALHDPESSVRIAAVDALATLHGTSSVAAIFAALENGEYAQFKSECCETLALIADLDDIIGRVGSESLSVREVSARVIYQLGRSTGVAEQAFGTLRNMAVRVDEVDEIRYWAILGQTGLIPLLNTEGRNLMLSDFSQIVQADTESPIVQLQAVFGIENLATYMSSSQRLAVASDLTFLFKKYGYGSTRSDAAYGWRMIGNALIELEPFGADALRVIMDPEVSSVTVAASGANDGSHLPSRSVDGSGLNYGKHTWNHTDMWLSNSSVAPWIRFEFDRVYKLEKMQFWNYNQAGLTNRGIRHAQIEYSVDAVNWVVLHQDYEFTQASGANGYAHDDDISFNSVAAKYVKITPHAIVANDSSSGNWGNSNQQVGVSEVIFNISADDPLYPKDNQLSWLAYQVLYERQQAKTKNAEGFNLVLEEDDIRDHKRYAPNGVISP